MGGVACRGWAVDLRLSCSVWPRFGARSAQLSDFRRQKSRCFLLEASVRRILMELPTGVATIHDRSIARWMLCLRSDAFQGKGLPLVVPFRRNDTFRPIRRDCDSEPERVQGRSLCRGRLSLPLRAGPRSVSFLRGLCCFADSSHFRVREGFGVPPRSDVSTSLVRWLEITAPGSLTSAVTPPSGRPIDPNIGSQRRNMGNSPRCEPATPERPWVHQANAGRRGTQMFYMQNNLIESIQQDRHREAAAKRLNRSLRLPRRSRHRPFLSPLSSTSTARAARLTTPRTVG